MNCTTNGQRKSVCLFYMVLILVTPQKIRNVFKSRRRDVLHED